MRPALTPQRKTSRRRFLHGALLGAAAAGLAGAAAGMSWRWGRGGGRASGAAAGSSAHPGAGPAAGIDPRLRSHRLAGRLALDLRRPRALALDAPGRLYVAGDQVVQVYAPDFAGPAAGAVQIKPGGVPSCLAVGPDGRLYVGVNERVLAFDRDGKELAACSAPEPNAVLTSLAAAPDNPEIVYAADFANRRIWRMELSSRRADAIGAPANDGSDRGFIVPSPFFSVAVDEAGTVWATNPGRHRVEQYTPSGTYQGSWGAYAEAIDGFCGCCNPGYVALWRPGGVTAGLLTSEKGQPRVKVYDRAGALRAVVATAEDFAPQAQGLAIAADARGYVWVLDPRARAVLRFEPLNRTAPQPQG
jgi:hypothetical protein